MAMMGAMVSLIQVSNPDLYRPLVMAIQGHITVFRQTLHSRNEYIALTRVGISGTTAKSRKEISVPSYMRDLLR